MKRLLPLLLWLPLGCFSPDDIFVLTGTVSSPAPEGHLVRLLRGKPDEVGGCGELKAFKDATTDADGGFVLEVFRAQAQSLSGFTADACFRVEVEFPSGSRAAMALQRVSGPETLPALPDWRPVPSLDAGLLAFTPVTALPAEESPQGPQVTHRLEARTADGGLAWRQDDRVTGGDGLTHVRVPLRFDDAVLVEDEALVLRLQARVEGALDEREPGPGPGPFGRDGRGRLVEAEAGQTVVLPAGSAPPTRGLSCAPLADPCPMTDGLLAPVRLATPVTSLAVALPAPTAVKWVVLRSLETSSGLMAVLVDAADGGLTIAAQQVLPVSLWGANEWVLEVPLPDAGLLRLGEPGVTFVAIPLRAVAPTSRVVVSVPTGIRALAELSARE